MCVFNSTYSRLEMVRLTVETISDANHYVNPVKQREISLRNLQIPAIENLGVTKVRTKLICLK
jgi:hypothetical protein